MRYRSISILFLVCTWSVHASLYPVLENVRIKITSATSADYTFTQRLVDIGPDGDSLAPAGWDLSLGHKHNVNSGSPTWGYYSYDSVKIRANETYSQAGIRAYNAARGTLTIHHGGGPNGNECIGYRAASANATLFSLTRAPGGTCYQLPPGQEWCEIVESALEINHGVITVKNTTGNYDKSVAATVTCTAPMRIHLQFGQDSLALGGGVTSQLSTTPGPRANLNAGQSMISVNSKLTVPNNATPGDFARNTVLYITYD